MSTLYHIYFVIYKVIGIVSSCWIRFLVKYLFFFLRFVAKVPAVEWLTIGRIRRYGKSIGKNIVSCFSVDDSVIEGRDRATNE